MSKKKQIEEVTPEAELENVTEKGREENTAEVQDDWKDKYLRVLAEFDNFKKRTQKEKEMIYTDAAADAVLAFLPVMDGFDRAVAVGADSEEARGVLDGLSALRRQMCDILEQLGVTAVEAVGSEFDPMLHNAILHIEDENYGNNVVAEEFMKGYMLKDRIIRHSMVKVAN